MVMRNALVPLLTGSPDHIAIRICTVISVTELCGETFIGPTYG